MTRVGVATIQRGRRRHLARQVAGLDGGDVRPDRYVVVSMDPPGDGDPLAEAPPVAGPAPELLRLPVALGAPLPLAAARNAAVAALGDVDVAVLLDVDCIPGPELLARYAAASAAAPDRLLSGPVGRLPPGVPAGLELSARDRARAAAPDPRGVPGPGSVIDEPRQELFWSLSFAVRPETHERLGGFDEAYVGYGGEDTDYAFRARRCGVGLARVGSAWAYHQHHPVSHPPREHLDDIVRNARLFRERWGRWPMEGWLRVFADEGLVSWDPEGEVLERRSETSPPPAPGDPVGQARAHGPGAAG